jgi:hypothetical protein
MSQPFNHINTTCKDGTTIVGAERNQEITEDESPSNGGSDSGPVAGLEIDRFDRLMNLLNRFISIMA